MKACKVMYKEPSAKLSKGRWNVKSKRNAGQFARFKDNQRQKKVIIIMMIMMIMIMIITIIIIIIIIITWVTNYSLILARNFSVNL